MIVSPTGGKIMALRSAPGEYLQAGSAVAQLRDAEDQPLQAVLHLTPIMAQHIRPGMRASVEIAMPDGATRRFDGEVASMTSGPLPNWLVALQPAAMGSTHRVDIALPQTSDLSLPDGTRCRVRIVLGRQSLISLLGLGRS